MKHVHAGKVRDLYRLDDDTILLVASDRISVYDVTLPSLIPDKGALLTQLSAFWFERFAELVPTHCLSTTDVPEEFAGRAVKCRPLKMVMVECIARGHLTGLGLAEYRRTGSVSGVRLPAGLVEGSPLPEPIFTPTTKATEGHDEFITFDDVINQVGYETAHQLRELTLDLYRRGAEHAAERGVIIADTKLEFGHDADGVLTLGDEVLTPDSSRFWPAEDFEPGRARFSFDKQYVRDWAAATGWDRTPPGPELPAEVIEQTRRRYIEVYELITGRHW